MFDEYFWIALAFFAFVFLVFKPVKAFILAALDSRVAKIKADLEEAERLKIEAGELLDNYKKKYDDAVNEAGQIIENANKEADLIKKSAVKEFEEAVKKRTEIVVQRIAQAEAAALGDIQRNAVDLAVSATRMVLRDRIDQSASEEMLNLAIREIEGKLH